MTMPSNETPFTRLGRTLFPNGPANRRLIAAVVVVWVSLTAVGLWTVYEANRRLVSPDYTTTAGTDEPTVALPVTLQVGTEGASPWDHLDRTRIPPAEWIPGLPAETVAVIGSHRWHHGAEVTAIAVSPDGRFVVTGGVDACTRLWDAATGNMLAALPGQRHTPDTSESEELIVRGTITSVSFRADGRRLAVGGGWNKVSIDPLRNLSGWVQVWDLTADGPILAATFDCVARANAVAAYAPTGDVLAMLPGPNAFLDPLPSISGPIEAELLEPDGERWVSRGLWEVPGSCDTIAWSPDGRRIATACAAALTIWNVRQETPGERAVRHRLRWWLAGACAVVVFMLVLVAALRGFVARFTFAGIAFFGTLFPFLMALKASAASGDWVDPIVPPILLGCGVVLSVVLLLASRLVRGVPRAILGSAAVAALVTLGSAGFLCMSLPWALPFGAVAGLYQAALLHRRRAVVPVTICAAMTFAVVSTYPFLSAWEIVEPSEKTQPAEWKLLAVAAVFAVVGAIVTVGILSESVCRSRRVSAGFGTGVAVMAVAAAAIWLWNRDVRPAPVTFLADLEVPGGERAFLDHVRIAFSPNREHLVAVRKQYVRLWEFDGDGITQRPDTKLTDDRDVPANRDALFPATYSAGGVAFDPSGQRLVVAVNFDDSTRRTGSVHGWTIDGGLRDRRDVSKIGRYHLAGVTALAFWGSKLLTADDGFGYGSGGTVSQWSTIPTGGWEAPSSAAVRRVSSCVLVGEQYVVTAVTTMNVEQDDVAYRAWDLHAAEPASILLPVEGPATDDDLYGRLWFHEPDVVADIGLLERKAARAWRIREGRFIPLSRAEVRSLPRPTAVPDALAPALSAYGRMTVELVQEVKGQASPARKVVITGPDGGAKHEIEFPLLVHSLKLTSDGRHLVTCNGNRTITVLRLRDADPAARLLSDAEEWIRRDPRDGVGFRRRGEALARLGRYAEAIADFKVFIRLSSEDGSK